MKIYSMTDIHGCLPEFNCALSLIENQLEDQDTKLILLGDYIHGPDSYGVLDRIIGLQQKYGSKKVIALLGNHEEMVCNGWCSISSEHFDYGSSTKQSDRSYIMWMKRLPRYYTEGKTIFVHAGINEEAADLWELSTDKYTFVEKYPAQTGKFYANQKIVAGHVGTAGISGDSSFHDIFYDGESHYYIDGTVLESGIIPVLMVDTDKDQYYSVTKNGEQPILPYCVQN